MTYEPEIMRPVKRKEVNINDLFVKYEDPDRSKVKKTWQSIRTSNGKTYGEIELPECAPLVFPALEAANKSENPEVKVKLKGMMKSFQDRLDRKSQMKFV